MSEGEKIAAASIGIVLSFASLMGSLAALWYQNAAKALVFGLFAFTAAWLFRFAIDSMKD